MKKTCTGCSESKDISSFHKKKENSDGFDYYCKTCKAISKIKYLLSIGENVNEARFKAVFNGQSAIAKKVFDSVPKDTYWAAGRIANEMSAIHGANPGINIINGCLNTLLKSGLVIEGSPGLFSKVSIKKKAAIQNKEYEFAMKPLEIKMQAKENTFDAIREIVIKFMDVAKTINHLASEIDARISDAEKQVADNEKDTEKLKQLQLLLKSLG